MKIEVSAPGKLVLIGEYGVLFGSPALVMAVDRRARVELAPAKAALWTLTAPDVAPLPVELEVFRDGEMRWLDDVMASRYFDLVDRLLCALADDGVVTLGSLIPAAVTLDTTSFFGFRGGSRRKLGLGSSAALTVALASALVGWSAAGGVPEADPQWLSTLVELHRRLQGGLGSGIDVAASLLGGVVEYRLDDHGSVSKAAPTELPGDLAILSIWTGRSAATGSFLARLENRRTIDPGSVERVIRGVVDVSRVGAQAIKDRSASGFLDAVDRFWDALEDLGHAIDAPILSKEHRRLRRLALECGVRYKPSGAGGGDFGLAFDIDPERLAAMANRARGDGFDVVDLRLDPAGVAYGVVDD